MIRVAVVDDEPHARAAIRTLLKQREDVEVAAECRNGLEAVEVLHWLQVDLLLLDVQMPGMNGFDVIRALGPDRVPPTIFVTAFDTFALRAFEVEAIDYVLKPFDEARFFRAFDRACRRLDQISMADQARRLLATVPGEARAPSPARPARLPVPAGDRIVFLNFDVIDWIQAADQYVLVHVGTREYLLREPLQHLATRLPADQFMRIHRSHIVNLSKVREVTRQAKGDAEVELADGRRLRWSRRYGRAMRRTLRTSK